MQALNKTAILQLDLSFFRVILQQPFLKAYIKKIKNYNKIDSNKKK